MRSYSPIAIAVFVLPFLAFGILVSSADASAGTATSISALTPPPTAPSTPTAISLTARVVDGIPGLRLRSGPGLNYTVLRSLPPGAALRLTGRSADGAWLAVRYGSLSGWVAARYVRHDPVTLALVTPTSVPTSGMATPVPAPPSPAPTDPMSLPAVAATGTPVPPPASSAHVVLGPDTAWPVRAGRISGWGYEFVDASSRWDLILHRDVFGVVAHSFWGSALYERHPHGIRLTLIDPVWQEGCPSPVAPMPLMADAPCLMEGFGDGVGAQIYTGCALASQHYTDPLECYIAIVSGGEHLSDIVAAAAITGYNMLVAGYPARTPDFAQAPFTPLLGDAYREGDQWRWRNLFLEVVPQT